MLPSERLIHNRNLTSLSTALLVTVLLNYHTFPIRYTLYSIRYCKVLHISEVFKVARHRFQLCYANSHITSET